jgi:hypothetical protein
MDIFLAPTVNIDFIINRCKTLIRKGVPESEEYQYWVEWLSEVLGNMSDGDWEETRKKVKKIKKLDYDLHGESP